MGGLVLHGERVLSSAARDDEHVGVHATLHDGTHHGYGVSGNGKRNADGLRGCNRWCDDGDEVFSCYELQPQEAKFLRLKRRLLAP